MLKNILDRVKNASTRKRNKHTARTHEQKAFSRQARDISKYIWLNPGLNRHERRSLASKIRRKKFKPAEAKIAKFNLKNTPANYPARYGVINNPMHPRFKNEAVSAN